MLLAQIYNNVSYVITNIYIKNFKILNEVDITLSNLNLRRMEEWFKKQGEEYTIKHDLKEHIDFSVFDLLTENNSCPPNSIYGDFDLVICANLLFYYKPEFRKKIMDKASHCLAKGGYVVTGETEREIMMQYNFEEIYPQSCIFRKRQA